LAVADEIGARSLALPAISTGVYGYPALPAATIAVTTVRETSTKVETVRFIAFDEKTLRLYQQLLCV
jgi:O-acetyl-ADP-ribose deacetylase (regulator of RNase III)